MRRPLPQIAGLTLLLFLLDRLYRLLHPEVDLVRASLVGATALVALAPLGLLRRRPLEPWAGALAIFASAFGSVLLIEAGVLASRSLVSGIVHVLILAAAYPALERAVSSAARSGRAGCRPGADRNPGAGARCRARSRP